MNRVSELKADHVPQLRSFSYGDERIRAAVIEKPFLVKVDEAFGKGGSGCVLAGLFIGHSRLKNGVLCPREKMRGISPVEESFAGGVSLRREIGSAAGDCVFTVVDQDNFAAS